MDVGPPSFEAIAGTHAAVEYLASLGSGRDRRAALTAAYAAIRAHETAHAVRFLDGLTRLPAWRVWGITDPVRIGDRVSTFGLTHRTKPAAEIAAVLGAQGLHNTAEEVDRVLVELATAD